MAKDALMEKLQGYGADLNGIKERFMGDAELYEKCYTLFLKDENFDLLTEALEHADYKRAFTASHTLKGVAGNMGLTPIYMTICRLVEALRAEHYEGISDMCEQIIKDRERLAAMAE